MHTAIGIETHSSSNGTMSSLLYFEDLEIGQFWLSAARTITECDVVQFAQLTGDFDPLHVDQHFAATTHFGRPVAHGLLGLSWLAGLSSHAPQVRTVALVSIRDWSFLRPLYFGDTVHVRTEVREKSPSGRRAGRVQWHRSLINQRGETTQQGILETLVAMRTTPPRSLLRRGAAPAGADAAEKSAPPE